MELTIEYNDAGQKVVGGVPHTKLTPSDLITYWGAIVGSNSDGDLAVWDGEADVIHIFNAVEGRLYDYSTDIEEDLAGRDLAFVMELIDQLLI
jgi:hypothetical protein